MKATLVSRGSGSVELGFKKKEKKRLSRFKLGCNQKRIKRRKWRDLIRVRQRSVWDKEGENKSTIEETEEEFPFVALWLHVQRWFHRRVLAGGQTGMGWISLLVWLFTWTLTGTSICFTRMLKIFSWGLEPGGAWERHLRVTEASLIRRLYFDSVVFNTLNSCAS